MLDRLLEYDAWATSQVAITLQRVEASDDRPDSLLRATVILGHCLAAHRIWQERCGGEPANCELWPTPDLAAVPSQAQALQAAWQVLLANRNLAEPIEYHNSRGGTYVNALGDIVMHIITHGNYHRGQIALLLGRNNITPPATDFIHALRSGQIASDHNR